MASVGSGCIRDGTLPGHVLKASIATRIIGDAPGMSRSVWSAPTSAALSRGGTVPNYRSSSGGWKAVLKPPQSKRFASLEVDPL
jgi:hypothetical protein